MQPESYYSTPDQYVGKSLADIRRSTEGNVAFRPDILASQLGISESTPLTAGQNLTFRGDPNSAEGQFASRSFGAGQNPSQQAVQPAVQTLQSQQAPLKQRYSDLLKSIKDRGAQEVAQTDINSARELGRRGITTDSTFAGQFQQQQRVPVQTQFAGLEAETGLAAEQSQQALAQAIAQLQAGAGQSEIQRQLQLAQMAQQTREAELNRNLQRELAPTAKEESPYTSLSEGQTLFNLLTGKPIYTAPKTYKPEGGSGNDPLGIF